MRTSIITGLSGQDGQYLAEHLLSREYRVVGTSRDVQAATRALPDGLASSVEIVKWDMRDESDFKDILSQYAPTEIYNFGAYTSGSGMYADAVATGNINGLAVARILEAIRTVSPRARFCQASSREIFGAAQKSPQDELTPANPRSPYGAAKLYADLMIRIYRQMYNIFACSAILFNHESPRRGFEFVTRRISYQAVRIKLGLQEELELGDLEGVRDWGFAGDYVRAMWLMLQQQAADDYVLATGKSHSVRELCDCAFSRLGLNYRDFVRDNKHAPRAPEATALVGDATKARNKLGWAPVIDFEKLVHMMVDADLDLLSRNPHYKPTIR